ncbi:hypothetical protein K457DRAFT_873819 [Linnemannia elongata AG-77]|uniref:Uncharacterized protein n=1 Tax=Linnemannia elongata AG-77 TaxID=1314771 RepID=A0A197JHV0_9FUNG|nr:hypothetical protein K457DRAFT_873819 [Linnemannia elongata AG-77]
MNSSDIPRFLPSFLFSCCVCFCFVFPISIQEDCTAITFPHFLSFLSFLYASLFFTCSPTIICLQVNTHSLTTNVTTIHCLIRFPLALSFIFVASSHH